MAGILGDLVLAVHAAWVLFNLTAPLLAVRRPRWRIAHLAALGATLLFTVTLGVCPLTILENRLRDAAYPGGFLRHYLMEIVYWDVPQTSLTAAAVLWTVFWAGVYAAMWRRERA